MGGLGVLPRKILKNVLLASWCILVLFLGKNELPKNTKMMLTTTYKVISAVDKIERFSYAQAPLGS